VLSQERHEWLTFPLTEPQILGKRRALEAHHSQIRISRAYLRSFVRSNELFEPLIFPVNRFSSHLWREGERVLPEEVSPNAPMITFLPGAEIKALEIRADEQGWYLRVLLRSHPLSHLTYRLFLHGLGQEGETVVHRKVLLQLPTASASNATLRAITPLPSPAASGPIVSSQRIPGGWEVRIPRDGLAPSQVLLYGAEVRWHRRTLDRTSLSCWNGPESDATPVPAEQEGEHP
jgi:hypothetical protein